VERSATNEFRIFAIGEDTGAMTTQKDLEPVKAVSGGDSVAFDGTVIDYVAEEVYRQGHNTDALDGIQRVGWMLNAWAYALTTSALICCNKPRLEDVIKIGRLVEPIKNRSGIRQCGVRVGSHICPGPKVVRGLLEQWHEQMPALPDPLREYRGLLEIHPFVDGNGRTGKIVLNWINGTLLRPVFPPNDFWGRWIQNP